jgi:rfaE bifunctional protein nucleotidyltransferase chain/domain
MRYSFGIVGLGRVGGAMLTMLRDAGHSPVWAVSSKPEAFGIPVTGTLPASPGGAQVVLIAVPDGHIREVSLRIARTWEGACRGIVFLHLSGLLTSEELAALSEQGAEVGSLHPLQSIPDASRARQILKGSLFTFEGTRGAGEAARMIAASLGVEMIPITREDKVLYHASAVMASNYLVALMDQASQVIASAGLTLGHLMPLVRGTLANVEAQGSKALTGPVARGDWSTVRAHVDALRERYPDLLPVYLELGRYTARMAGRRFPEDLTAHPALADLDELCDILAAKKARGMRVVFTNGCFDIVHAGHVTYLARARSLGDCLVVGLNSDESVRRIKGQDRPVNTEQARAAVLGALSSVDHVVLFGEDTPLRLIDRIRPDVLVKGGDWAVQDIVGADVVRAAGGEVLTIPFEEGFSTTGIIGRIRRD